MKAHLLVCFSIFDFKTLKDNKLKNNVKNNFLFETHSLFNKFLKDSDSFESLKTKIMSSSNNNSLFYTGVEDKAKRIANNLLPHVESLVKEIFSYSNLLSVEQKTIKMKIGKTKTESLLCLLFILLSESNSKNINDDEIKAKFILFPLKFDDFH